MKQRAIDKANQKLEKAIESHKRIKLSQNFKEFESAWADFLLAINGIHMAINTCMHDNNKIRQWCGEKKKFAKKDRLYNTCTKQEMKMSMGLSR
jgi:hypothetical protein